MAAQPSMIFPVPKPPANAQISPNPRRFRYQQNASSLSDAEISSTQQASTAAVPSPVSVDEQVPTLSEPTASGSVAHWRSMRKQAQERETRPLNAPVEFVPLEDGKIWCQNLHNANGYMVSLDQPLSRSSSRSSCSLNSLPGEMLRTDSALRMRQLLDMEDEDNQDFLMQDEEEQPQCKSESSQLMQSMLQSGPLRQGRMEFTSGLLRNLEVLNQDSDGEMDTVPASSTSAAQMRSYLAHFSDDRPWREVDRIRSIVAVNAEAGEERETRPLNAPVEFVPLEDGRIWCQNLHDNNGYMVSLDTPLSRSSSLSSLPAETPRSNSALHMRDMLMGDEDLENFLTQDEEEQPQRPQRKSDSAQLLQSMLRLGPMRQDCMEFSSGLLRNLEDNLEVTNQADSSGSETDTVPASSTSAAHMRYYLANLLGDETLAGS
eukprot:CAMPEP_0197706374 /NCGR_PEP_ID=MMETSP1338-20131121/126913_1 /TAXON_ID=43686 ORGANISM="Pelagodinium beii, Strain RCC1491" /NCGR_SAMPLE_ID=MMETSP1338 /ASSEMBLY_ACC=CAM_ASM_000754 /LENGTH=431 /DNA_ID=CAMNT_0043290287 /DNA_START=28 /DNA_END=1325 /DNA_ORIENTATION=-